MTDHPPPTHPNFGSEVRVETVGNIVRLIFVADTEAKAIDLAESIIAQLEMGDLRIVLKGKPTEKTTEIIDTILRETPSNKRP